MPKLTTYMLRKTLYFFDSFITKRNLILLLSIQNVLSICSVFSSPLPFPPKTSIGMLTVVSFFIIIFLVRLFQKKQLVLRNNFQLVDLCVYTYVIANGLSLVCSQYIYDITNFRLLLSAVVQYIAVRLLVFTAEEKSQSIHVIGVVTVVVAAMSLFQVVFRDQVSLFAKNFLFGEAAYSIAYDLERGRGVQWGNIVITFPFFVYSALLIQKKKGFLKNAYIWLGILLIPLSFILSNFRGLTICFFIGIFVLGFFIIKRGMLSIQKIIPVIAVIFCTVALGIVLASIFFQYNLIDRFLFKEPDRDVKSTLGRFDLYEQASSAFFASPIIGVGTGNYRYNVERVRVVSYYNIIDGETGVKETDKESVSSHNDILTILAETGLLGFVSYIGVLFFVIKALFTYVRRQRKKEQSGLFLPTVFILSLGLLLLSGVFENTPSNTIVYVFFLFGASLTWFL